MILNETVAKIADAIREKKGTTDPIAPINFAEEIKSIPVGGGGSSASTVWYLDVSGIDVPDGVSIDLVAIFLGALVKFTQTEYKSEEIAYKGIADAFTIMVHQGYDGIRKVTALAIPTGVLDLPIKVTHMSTGKVTSEGVTKDVIDAAFGGLVTTILNCPRITKEQFYTLE